MKLLRRLGYKTFLLLNTARLSGEATQVENTCTTHFTSLGNNYAFDERRRNWEDTLNTYTSTDLTNSKCCGGC